MSFLFIGDLLYLALHEVWVAACGKLPPTLPCSFTNKEFFRQKLTYAELVNAQDSSGEEPKTEHAAMATVTGTLGSEGLSCELACEVPVCRNPHNKFKSCPRKANLKNSTWQLEIYIPCPFGVHETQ